VRLSAQLAVFTVMYCLHFLFNLLHVYEFTNSMPKWENKYVWDLQKHGLPGRFRIFGLPSVWYAQKADQDKMLKFVKRLHAYEKVMELYPEELALLVMNADTGELRMEVAKTLRDAILQPDVKAGSVPQSPSEMLELELCIFDAWQSSFMDYFVNCCVPSDANELNNWPTDQSGAKILFQCEYLNFPVDEVMMYEDELGSMPGFSPAYLPPMGVYGGIGIGGDSWLGSYDAGRRAGNPTMGLINEESEVSDGDFSEFPQPGAPRRNNRPLPQNPGASI